MRDCDVVVLSRFPQIFEGFRESVDRDAPTVTKTVIWDQKTTACPEEYLELDGMWFSTQEPPGTDFKIAAAANHGLGLTKGDVFYCGDDTRIFEPNTIQRLRELAYSDPAIGILSPRIIGHAQTVQTHPKEFPITSAPFVAFVFVLIKREVIDAIGYLDERYEGYGYEDCDYCVRARLAGFKIGVAAEISVKHGVNGHVYGSTFIKVKGEEQMGKEDRANRARFAEKWGIENDPRKVWEFIENPDRSKVPS